MPMLLRSMGFFYQWMTDMKPDNPNCLLLATSSYLGKTPSGGRSIDPRTAQALHQLRQHAEELALELAVRLRVLGKSLAAACPGPGVRGGRRTDGSSTYNNLRRQLDGFFGSLADRDFAVQHYFPVVREYFQETLPFELNGCVGDESCRIEQVEAVISLLSESSCGNGAFTEGLMTSISP